MSQPASNSDFKPIQFTKGQCFYCQVSLTKLDKSKNRLAKPSREHIVPRSMGGNDTEYNLIPCCTDCNQFRGNKSLARFVIDLPKAKWINRKYAISQIEKLRNYIYDAGTYLFTPEWLQANGYDIDQVNLPKSLRKPTKKQIPEHLFGVNKKEKQNSINKPQKNTIFVKRIKLSNQQWRSKLKKVYPHAYSLVEDQMWVWIYDNLVNANKQSPMQLYINK